MPLNFMYKTVMMAVLTFLDFRRTLEVMLAGFDAAYAKGKELVADFRANEKFNLPPAYHCAALDRQIDALVDDHDALISE